MTDISFDEEIKWRETLSSCAIEGNKTAIKMLELRKINYREYLKQLREFIKGIKVTESNI